MLLDIWSSNWPLDFHDQPPLLDPPHTAGLDHSVERTLTIGSSMGACRSLCSLTCLLRLLPRQSGGLLDYTNLVQLSDLGRHTVKANIEAMRIGHAVFLLPPFEGGGRREITCRPKCYAFDPGFVTFVRGWESIREDDRGILWDHVVLDCLPATVDENSILYWRDKSGREVVFVVKRARGRVDAVECKISPDGFDPANLRVFRSFYPDVCIDIRPHYLERFYQVDGLVVKP